MPPNSTASEVAGKVTEDHVTSYEKDGYVVIEGFLSPSEVQKMKEDTTYLIRKGLAESSHNQKKVKVHGSAGTSYHMDSQDKAWLFLEDNSLDEEGKLLVDELRAVHKIGHASHNVGPAAAETIFSAKMKEVVKKLTKFENPVVTQSMYLLKQPKIGGKRDIHQDETYLRTEPQGKVFGVWIALDDATIENGCLDFILGSHVDPRFVPLARFHDRIGGEKTGLICDYRGEAAYQTNSFENEFKRCPMKSGDMVLLHGLTVHKSEANKSSFPRAAFTFHCYEKTPDVNWVEENMWKETEGRVFQPLYTHKVNNNNNN